MPDSKPKPTWNLSVPESKLTPDQEAILVLDPAALLEQLRAPADGIAVTVWQDGGYSIQNERDAMYCEADPDWLCTIPLTEAELKHALMKPKRKSRDA